MGSGLDWGLTDASGTFSPDAIYVLQTSDGANIMVTEKGHAPNVLIQFETGAEDYSWMNSIVGYATGAPTDTGVHLDVWQVGDFPFSFAHLSLIVVSYKAEVFLSPSKASPPFYARLGGQIEDEE